MRGFSIDRRMDGVQAALHSLTTEHPQAISFETAVSDQTAKAYLVGNEMMVILSMVFCIFKITKVELLGGHSEIRVFAEFDHICQDAPRLEETDGDQRADGNEAGTDSDPG